MADEKGRSRRDWLRSLSGAGFFGAVAEACTPAARHPRNRGTTPPSEKWVIPAGSEAQVLALIGPLAHGPLDGGYKLAEAQVSADRIDYLFDGAPGRVRVSLVALAATDAGVARAYTRSFRLLADGDAPEETRAKIADLVAAEVLARDNGQLWVKALTAPRSDGGR